MTSGIIVILAALIPLLVQLINKHMSASNQQQERNETLEKAIATGDSYAINRFLHDRLPNKDSGNTR